MEPDCADRSPQLPALLWQKVFLYLGNRPLARVRLTCRTWKAIVDQCPALQDKFIIFFPPGLLWDSSYRPKFLHPAASKVFFADAQITYSGSWWCALGARLTELIFYSCRFTICDLVGMLRATPNLRSLNIHEAADPNDSKEVTIRPGNRFAVNFQLRKLQELNLKLILNAEDITYVIERMRPPLKVFRHFSAMPLSEHVFCRFVQAVAGTLDTLEATLMDKAVLKLARMKQLVQLKRLTLYGVYHSVAETFKLVRKQPLLECLTLHLIDLTNKEICTILSVVPKLHTLSVSLLPEIDEPDTLVPFFLRRFPNFQNLVISGCTTEADPAPESSIRFPEGVECLQLVDLTLELVVLDERFPDFWKGAPKLATLKFSNCILSEVFTLTDMLNQAKFLKKLAFEEVQLDSEDVCDLMIPRGLKELELKACKWPETAIITLVCYCPELESVSLIDMPTVTDTVLLVILQRANLRELTLDKCPLLTERCAGRIRAYDQKMERLIIHDCEPVLKMMILMKEHAVALC